MNNSLQDNKKFSFPLYYTGVSVEFLIQLQSEYLNRASTIVAMIQESLYFQRANSGSQLQADTPVNNKSGGTPEDSINYVLNKVTGKGEKTTINTKPLVSRQIFKTDGQNNLSLTVAVPNSSYSQTFSLTAPLYRLDISPTDFVVAIFKSIGKSILPELKTKFKLKEKDEHKRGLWGRFLDRYVSDYAKQKVASSTTNAEKIINDLIINKYDAYKARPDFATITLVLPASIIFDLQGKGITDTDSFMKKIISNYNLFSIALVNEDTRIATLYYTNEANPETLYIPMTNK